MDIVFWQIVPSHHQSGALRRLADIWDGEVYGVFDSRQIERRQTLGWQSPNMGRINTFFLDEQPSAFASEFCEKHADAIHVLGGFRGCRSVTLAWRFLRKRPDAKLACIAERPRFKGCRAILQWLWYRTHFAVYGSRFKAVLAMGTLGVDCFKRLGCSRDRLYPYMYQSGTPPYPPKSKDSSEAKQLHFVYIGQLNSRKGIDLILNACLKISDGWTLDVFGSIGEQEHLLMDAAKTDKDGRIRHHGRINSDEVVNHLRLYDICVIPSRHDGWGVVTNEALAAGIGVLVSDTTGSKDLIEASGAGMIVEANNETAWTAAIRHVLDNPELVPLWKNRAAVYREQISANVVGDYLAAVLNYAFRGQGSRPEAPWLIASPEPSL